MTNTLAFHDNVLWETIICIERKHVNLINARKLRERENGTARFKKQQQLFEYKHLLLFRDIYLLV